MKFQKENRVGKIIIYRPVSSAGQGDRTYGREK